MWLISSKVCKNYIAARHVLVSKIYRYYILYDRLELFLYEMKENYWLLYTMIKNTRVWIVRIQELHDSFGFLKILLVILFWYETFVLINRIIKFRIIKIKK